MDRREHALIRSALLLYGKPTTQSWNSKLYTHTRKDRKGRNRVQIHAKINCSKIPYREAKEPYEPVFAGQEPTHLALEYTNLENMTQNDAYKQAWILGNEMCACVSKIEKTEDLEVLSRIVESRTDYLVGNPVTLWAYPNLAKIAVENEEENWKKDTTDWLNQDIDAPCEAYGLQITRANLVKGIETLRNYRLCSRKHTEIQLHNSYGETETYQEALEREAAHLGASLKASLPERYTNQPNLTPRLWERQYSETWLNNLATRRDGKPLREEYMQWYLDVYHNTTEKWILFRTEKTDEENTKPSLHFSFGKPRYVSAQSWWINLYLQNRPVKQSQLVPSVYYTTCNEGVSYSIENAQSLHRAVILEGETLSVTKKVSSTTEPNETAIKLWSESNQGFYSVKENREYFEKMLDISEKI